MIVFEVQGKSLQSNFSDFLITRQPPPGVVTTLSDLLGFTAGALYYRNYCNLPKEMRNHLYDAAHSILDSGTIPVAQHPSIIRKLRVQVIRPRYAAVQLHFVTRPRIHWNRRRLQASVAAATLAYTGFVLKHPDVDRHLIEYALTALVEEHSEFEEKDWLPPRLAIYAQQYVLDELAEVLKTRLAQHNE